MLKYCSADVHEIFALKVIQFINPNFENGDFTDQYSDASMAKMMVVEFARKCKLTAQEFLDALDLVPRGELTIIDQRPNGEEFEKPLKLFSRIDAKNLIEIETSYLRYKIKNKQYEAGLKKLKEFFNPIPELTEEEKAAEHEKWLRSEYKRLQEKGEVLGSVVFYSIIRKRGYKAITLDVLEKILRSYQSEKPDGGISIGEAKLKIVKIDPFVHFQNVYVDLFIKHHKLMELNEDKWVKYWKN